MSSKYKIIKILENCFHNMNCLSCFKIIPFLIHLKYWYYNSSYLELPYVSNHLCQILPYPTETLFNTVLIMFFISFPILSYPIRLQATTKYWKYQTICKSKRIKFIGKLNTDHNTLWMKHATQSWVFKIRISFKVRQHGQQPLYLSYNLKLVIRPVMEHLRSTREHVISFFVLKFSVLNSTQSF